MAHHVVVVGGGFGGLHAVRGLRAAPVQVTLVDRRNFHLFQPLLYQVATGGLSPANIATPLRHILRRQKNCNVLLREVTGFDVQRRKVLCEGMSLSYDTLIVASGAKHSYFGNDGWEPLAPGLKTIEDATEIRRRILSAFEYAEQDLGDTDRLSPWLTFVVVGGGPTGVELAGALAEIANHTLKHEFRHIDPRRAQIMLVEAAEHVLSVYPRDLAAKAADSLHSHGVEVRTSTKLVDIQPDHVVLETNGSREELATKTVLWAAGVQASPLGKALTDATGAETDRAGRVMVQPDMSLEGHPEIFVLGDLAHCPGPDGKPLPGLAPVAMQQGSFVAQVISARLSGKTPPTFHYRDHGTMATIGRASAVAQLGGWKFSGRFAWLMWLFIHLMELVQFQNRVLVFVQWGWNYITRNRSARLITGGPAEPASSETDYPSQEVESPA